MDRTDMLDARPLNPRDAVLLRDLLDAHAACQNTINYARRQAYFDEKHSAGHSTVTDLEQAVDNAMTSKELENQYKQEIGTASAQQHYQKNREAWNRFFDELRKYRDPDNNEVQTEPSPPSYWKHDDGTRPLHGVFRCDRYDIEHGERSRLRIPVGMAMKERYGLGHNEKLWLELAGQPRWTGENARFELTYDRETESFTAHHTVTNATLLDDSMATTPSGDTDDDNDEEGVVAAVDIGANTLAAVVTSDGHSRLYDGATPFEEFKQASERIADLQEALGDETYTSRRIQQLYEKRTRRRNHAQDALIRDLAEWLAERGVTELIAGDLSDVLDESHWKPTVNLKNVNFWAHGRFRERLHEVLEGEYGITVREESEHGTSSRCPTCDSEDVERNGDELYCPECDVQGHADLAGAVNFLQAEADDEVAVDVDWPMARPAVPQQNKRGSALPARCQWDDHEWTPTTIVSGERSGRSTNAVPANQSTTRVHASSDREGGKRGNVALDASPATSGS